MKKRLLTLLLTFLACPVFLEESAEAALTVNFTNSVVCEGVGTLTNWGRVDAGGAVLTDMSVTLSSSDTSEIVVATSPLTIPAGSQSAPFDVVAQRDSEFDGPRIVVITAHAEGGGVADGAGTLEVADAGGGQAMLISPGSTWNYLDDGSDQGTAWRNIVFPDMVEWLNGPAELGYGDGDEVTEVSYGGNPSNKFVTTYFRREFVVTNAFLFSGLSVSLLYDDGAVVYINGTEVLRTNMPAGSINYLTEAPLAVGGANESVYFETAINPAVLTNGINVVAVEVHQCSIESTDISFDLALIGMMYPRVTFDVTSVADRFTLEASNLNLQGSQTANFSGCAFMPATRELLVVVNSSPMLQVYGLDGTYKRAITLSGFLDTEAVCQYDADHGRFAVLEEGRGDIVIVTVMTNTTTITKSACEIIPTGITSGDNTGLEGIAYDNVNDCFYLCEEKNPVAVYRIKKTPGGVVGESLFDAAQVFAGKATDLSDLTYEPMSGHLFILSDENNRVFDCDMAGNIIASISVGGNQPEGVAFSSDGGTMYIIGEPNEYFRYSLPRLAGSGEETNTPLRLAVILSSPMAVPVTVGYAVTSATAVAGEDFTPASGTVTFAPGSTREILSIGIVSNDIPEPDETMIVTLTNGVNCATARDGVYEYTILGDKVKLDVASPFDLCQPPVGRNFITSATVLSCSVTGATVYIGTLATQCVCVGWTGTGDVPASGTGTNTGPFVLTNHSSIAWLWQTNYYLDVSSSGGGTVDVADGWFNQGSNVTITALPVVPYHLASWGGDTDQCVISQGQITVPMERPRTITAMFTIDTYSLTVASERGGATPPVGVNTYEYGTVLTCSLTNSPVFDGVLATQYVCAGWTGTGSVPANGATTNVTFTLTTNSSISWNWRGEAPGLSLVVSNSVVSEGEGALSGWGCVGVFGAMNSNLTVTLVSDDTTELLVPGSVTIPEGASSAYFDMTVVDDGLRDGAQSARITASAPGFVDGTNSISVLDTDIDHFSFQAIASPQTSGIPFVVTITARNTDDVTVTTYAGTLDMAGAGNAGAVVVSPATVALSNGQWSGTISVSKADTNVCLTATDGSGHAGASNPFNVNALTLDHFEWSPISTQQLVNIPFAVTISAKSSNNLTVADFTGSVSITGWMAVQNTSLGDGSSTEVFPMGTFNKDSRDQVIYMANDVGGARKISALSLYVSTIPGQMMNNWTIRMKHSSLSEYPATPSWEAGGWTVVYQANEIITATGWRKFVFSTPFDFNGLNNLVVDFSFHNASQSSSGRCRYTTATNNVSARLRTNTDYGDPLTWSGTSPSASVSKNYANILLWCERSVTTTPTFAVSFVGGVFTGSVTVLEGVTNMYLHAEDDAGHGGDGDMFSTFAPGYLVVSSPWGEASPPVGTNAVAMGATITCGITNSPVYYGALATQYACAGWTRTGSAPASGSGTNTGPFALTNNSTVAWNWRTNYWLAALTNGGGTVNGGNMWLAAGTSAVVEALSGQYYHFDGWSGDVGGGDTNSATLGVTMDRSRIITALFGANMAAHQIPEWWLAKHHGAVTNFDSIVLSDADGDGMQAWEEYKAGTDPTNDSSLLRIVRFSRNATGYVIYWSSVTDRNYTVFSATNLILGWPVTPIASNVPGDAMGTNACTDTTAATRTRFYRVGVQ